MSSDPIKNFFNDIATQWDGWVRPEILGIGLRQGLERFDVKPDETVVDLGCGTGNLTLALLKRFNEHGRVMAVDFSPRMLDQARSKVDDPRVTWIEAEAGSLPLENNVADRIICFSAWPHFQQPKMVAQELWRVLKPGAVMHIWHSESRETINAIHTGSSNAAIHGDLLVPVEELGALCADCGFDVLAAHEDDTQYLVTARKPLENV